MSVTREELAAFADGELGEPRRSQVAAEVEQDKTLAADVERHQALKAQLNAHFAPILEQPVPDRLADLLGGRDTTVVDLAAARQRREGRLRIPGWGWIAGPALAASVALAVLLPGRGTPEGYAAPQIAAVLDERLVAEQAPGEDVRVLLSFRDDGGVYCRAFSTEAQSGIACRDDKGWKLRLQSSGSVGQDSEYRTAGIGTATGEVFERAQSLAKGAALNAQQERDAQARGWRLQPQLNRTN